MTFQAMGIRRPNIGITPDHEPGTEAGAPRYVLKAAYAEAVLKGGGLPLLLPYSADEAVLEAYLDRISGLVVTGGAFDIAPEIYGETSREGMGPLKQGRTGFELALLLAALQRNMPVLGVCGGMQLLNVALGGTLVQDILREVPGARDHEQQHDRTQPAHPVDVRDGTALAECVGRGQLMVNSTHHQAIGRLGGTLRTSAAAPDGIVEAIESPDHTFAVGVQWHPELLVQTLPLHLGLYRALVQRARESRR